MKKIAKFLFSVVMAACLLTGVAAMPAMAEGCDKWILGAPAWYNGLPMDGNCAPQLEGVDVTEMITKIVTNVIEDMLAIAAYVCVGMIIYSGYLLVLSEGDASKVAKGKKSITGAIVGLIISILGYAIVNFIVGVLFNS